jgi:hypothetical protein
LDLVERSTPSEAEKEAVHGVRAGDVGAPATLGNFAHTGWKKRKKTLNNGDTPGSTGTLTASRYRVKKKGNGKEGETEHRRCEHSPWKSRNGGTPVRYSERIALMREQCHMYTHC